MKNRPVWFVPRNAPKVFRAGEGVSRSRTSIAGSQDPPSTFKTLAARVACRATRFAALFVFAPLVCFGQEPSPTPSPSEMEAEPIVVTATRFDIPLDLSPA